MPKAKPTRRILVITGTRAEFGLLRTVMRAINKHPRLELLTCVTGSHLLPPSNTWREVASEFSIHARVPMQRRGTTGRLADAAALGRGVSGIAAALRKLKPDWVVVLGDRIEAFAGASAASIAGIPVAHIHGGDRAEGIADEAMRHAITKLSHLHLAATRQSGERIIKMGEARSAVHVVGSPAIDELRLVKPMSDADAKKLGDPRAIMLLHPSGFANPRHEHALAKGLLGSVGWSHAPTLVLTPNHDPGREIIVKLIKAQKRRARLCPPLTTDEWETAPWVPQFVFADHLPRPVFLSLLKRLAKGFRMGVGRLNGMLIGNSSAGLIECAALGVSVLNVGPRQNGRERADNVTDVPFEDSRGWDVSILETNFGSAMRRSIPKPSTLFGDGRTGQRIAKLLARVNPHEPSLLRKHNTY